MESLEVRWLVVVGVLAVLGIFGFLGAGWASLPVLAYVGAGLFYITHFGGKLSDTIAEVVRGA